MVSGRTASINDCLNLAMMVNTEKFDKTISQKSSTGIVLIFIAVLTMLFGVCVYLKNVISASLEKTRYGNLQKKTILDNLDALVTSRVLLKIMILVILVKDFYFLLAEFEGRQFNRLETA